MKDEFILQTLGVSRLPLDLLIMVGMSTASLAKKNKVVLNCDNQSYNVLNNIGFNNVELFDTIKRVDNFDAKFDTMNSFKDEPYIHVDIDLYYDEKISFGSNDLIVGSVDVTDTNERSEYKTYLRENVNLLEGFPIITPDDRVFNYNHSVFGCKNKTLMDEYLENEKLHTIANVNHMKSLPRGNYLFYMILEQHHFYFLSRKYNLSPKIFEHNLFGNYEHYIGTYKYLREHKNEMIEKLKYYDISLYNKIVEYGHSSEYKNIIKNIKFKLILTWLDKYSYIDRSINYNNMVETYDSITWHYQNIKIENDNTPFKFYEFDEEWKGWTIGENDINISSSTTAEILHPFVGVDWFIENNCLVVAKKGIYDFILTYNPGKMYFDLEVIKLS